MNLSRFDLLSLRLVVLIEQCGSLSAAAQKMHLAVGAASRRLTELEVTVGQALFTRQRQGMQATDAGHQVVRHAQQMLWQLGAMQEDLRDLQHSATRHIRLCASSAAIVQFLPPLIAQFEQTHPQARIVLEEEMSDAVIGAVLQGRADVGVFAASNAPGKLACTPFRRDRLVLVMSAHHRLARGKTAVAFEQLRDEDWISLAQGAALLSSQQQAAIRAGFALRLRMQVRSFEAMAQLIAQGLGIGLMPQHAAMSLAAGMALRTRRLEDDWVERQLWIGVQPRQIDPWSLRLATFLQGSEP
jgi:DNA-binding transcriptional LysR family regulator